MAWLELHQTLPTNKKTLRMKSILKIKTPQAVGHLCMLWLWALDNAQDGNLSAFSADEIAEVSGWESKNNQTYIDALHKSGFLDEDMRLHDWFDYTGRLIEQRTESKAYKKRQYDLYADRRLIKSVKARDGDICQYCGREVNWQDRKGINGGTYDHIDPNGENTLENIAVCCRSCNSKKRGRTPEEAKMLFIETSVLREIYFMDNTDITQKNADNPQILHENNLHIPYPTVPNRTIPKNIGGDDARARANETVDEFVENRNLDMNAYFGMNSNAKAEIESLTAEIIGKFAKRKITDLDVFNVFSATRHSSSHITDTGEVWEIEFPKQRVELLMYAFEQAAQAGQAGNWNYIFGVLGNLRQRGIETLEDAERYDVERLDNKHGG